MKKYSAAPKRARGRGEGESPADSLAQYVEYLAWRAYRDGNDSDDLRNYEEDEDLDPSELWSSYWHAWHRHMLHSAYTRLDAEHQKTATVLAVMRAAPDRFAKILADPKARAPRTIDHSARSRLFTGTHSVTLDYRVPDVGGQKAADRFWKRLR